MQRFDAVGLWLSTSLVASIYQVGAGLVLLVAGALLWQNSPFALQGVRSRSQSNSEFCPDRSAPYSVPSELYRAFSTRTDLYGSSLESVQNFLGRPACTLPAIAIRADAVTEREVYYREDGAAIVVAYEDGVFVGHSVEGDPPPETIAVAQSWSVTAGDQIGGYAVLAGLGELSLKSLGFLYAPSQGMVSRQVNWSTPEDDAPSPLAADCVIYTSPAYPAYLSRFCGLHQSRSGTIADDDGFAQVGGFLHFALLTLRPTENQERRWHYVAPSPDFVTQFL